MDYATSRRGLGKAMGMGRVGEDAEAVEPFSGLGVVETTAADLKADVDHTVHLIVVALPGQQARGVEGALACHVGAIL